MRASVNRMRAHNTHAGDVRLVGGRLCLDFTNTAVFDGPIVAKEYWRDYAALLAWLEHAGGLDADALGRAAHAARERPDAASRALLSAIELRGALYRAFCACAAGLLVEQADLVVFNAALAQAQAPARALAQPAAGQLAWAWPPTADDLALPLWPALWSAADLLVSPELARVRQCEGAGCSWLFLDTSRNRSRRWCSMDDCGNLAKARRHYARRSVGARGAR